MEMHEVDLTLTGTNLGNAAQGAERPERMLTLAFRGTLPGRYMDELLPPGDRRKDGFSGLLWGKDGLLRFWGLNSMSLGSKFVRELTITSGVVQTNHDWSVNPVEVRSITIKPEASGKFDIGFKAHIQGNCPDGLADWCADHIGRTVRLTLTQTQEELSLRHRGGDDDEEEPAPDEDDGGPHA